MDLNNKVDLVKKVLEDKSAEDIEIIDISELTSETSVFVVATALNERHAKTVCEALDEQLSAENIEKFGIEGYDSGKWILVDLGDIIIHIFTKEERKIYSIEKLWRDGKFLAKRNTEDEND